MRGMRSYEEKVASMTPEDWRPLLDLIPGVEATDKFGEVSGLGTNSQAIFDMPSWTPAPIVTEFRDIVCNLEITIPFDWGEWDEGRQMAGNPEFDYDSVGIPAKCMLITAIIRNDRFCDGALISAFESGLILRILKSIARQVGKPF